MTRYIMLYIWDCEITSLMETFFYHAYVKFKQYHFTLKFPFLKLDNPYGFTIHTSSISYTHYDMKPKLFTRQHPNYIILSRFQGQ